MTQYYEEPGLYTDMLNPFETNGLDWPFLRSCGFTWVSFQVYNPQLFDDMKSFDLDSVRAHGFTNVGVWGIIYDTNDYFNGGKKMAMQAKSLGADHLKVDAEQVYKSSRDGEQGKEVIRGVRAGGWSKGVSLSTLGSPTNPVLFDFGMDTESFLTSGADACIEPQDYYNDYEEYTPKNSEIYWTRVGVPRSRINHTIGLYPGKRGKVSGAAWVGLLQDAKVGKNFSVYMAQHGDRSDYIALRDYINSQPTQTTQISSAAVREAMIFIAQRWLNGQLPNRQIFSRIRLAKRILEMTDKQLRDISGPIKQLLDDAGVNR